jgi:hypothetical protein
MHRIALELTRRALTLRVELTPDSERPVVSTQGVITVAGPGLAKTRATSLTCPSNVVPFPFRKVGTR